MIEFRFEVLVTQSNANVFKCVECFQGSHIAMIEMHTELAKENSTDLLEIHFSVAQKLLLGQSANLVHFLSACHRK